MSAQTFSQLVKVIESATLLFFRSPISAKKRTILPKCPLNCNESPVATMIEDIASNVKVTVGRLSDLLGPYVTAPKLAFDNTLTVHTASSKLPKALGEVIYRIAVFIRALMGLRIAKVGLLMLLGSVIEPSRGH